MGDVAYEFQVIARADFSSRGNLPLKKTNFVLIRRLIHGACPERSRMGSR